MTWWMAMDDRSQLFDILKRQKKSVLLDLLERSYDVMDPKQQRAVFGALTKQPPTAKVKAAALLEEVEQFRRDSLAGKYYQSFMINSKNWTHIPDKTDEWFDRLGDLLKDTSKLTGQGNHAEAVACFDRLYALIGAMESGDKEIVFADELGSWMIPVREEVWVADYLISLAATTTPDEFAAKAIPLIRRDSYQSFAAHTYKSALKAASKDQALQLKVEIKRLQIQTNPEKRSPRR
jgi:hypothetical protein